MNMRILLSAVSVSLLALTTQVMAAPISATLYKSPTCGCCGEYVNYLKKNNVQVKVVNTQNMFELQNRLGTANVASCHTMKIGKYVVEGHVPVEAINKLVKEQPNIKGIALPGMPGTAPGMGPAKKGSLTIVKIDSKGNSAGTFMVQ